MLKRNKQSGLINILSTSSIGPIGGVASYSAGKSFGHLFTLDLNEEIRYHVGKEKLQNVDILSLQSGLVDTQLTKLVKELPYLISPEQCAENALRVLGKVNYSSGHWKHLIYAFIHHNLPAYTLGSSFIKTLLKERKKTN